MNRRRKGPSPFTSVVNYIGTEKPVDGDQNEKRHYSEVFSQEVAEWLAGFLVCDERIGTVLPPEAPVMTSLGRKRLDVGAVDKNGYLALDISVKTFNFVDGRTKNYKKNYTGRFYELLGEAMYLHKSYPYAVLVAFIFLPEDSCCDSSGSSRGRAASSFGNAVRQFSKIAGREGPGGEDVQFEHVYVGLHSPLGEIFFFDATNPPPKAGLPHIDCRMTIEQVIACILNSVEGRAPGRILGNMRLKSEFKWRDDLETC